MSWGQRPHGMMRLSFPGISGPGRLDDTSLASNSSPKSRFHRGRTPGAGTKLKKTWPGHGLCVLHGSHHQTVSGVQDPPPSECVYLYSNIQISLLPQLLHPGVRNLSSGLLIPSAPVQEARTAFPIIGGETEGPVQ